MIARIIALGFCVLYLMREQPEMTKTAMTVRDRDTDGDF
jgi:hypothetical protein